MTTSTTVNERWADVVVAGGGVGGCAAAIACARAGRTVIITEETDWPGGQLTQQAVPPDEHRWIEQFGCTRSYREYRNRVRDWYRRCYPLTGAATRDTVLNPGGGLVSRLCHEPRVSLAVLNEMLQPHVSSGRIVMLLDTSITAVEAEKDVVTALEATSLRTGDKTILRGHYFLDATELGDLLPMAGVEYVTGMEARSETGEPHGAETADPENQQAFTCCFAMDYLAGEDHTVAQPESYGFWRDFAPVLHPPWPGPLLSLETTDPVTLAPRTHVFDPEGEAAGRSAGLWRYRRILDRSLFERGAFPADICLVNWPQNDYLPGTLIDVPADEAAAHVQSAKELSLSLLYWLQTEAPRPDGGTGWKGLRLRPDVVGTVDGLAKRPYIRESRRIRAEFTVLEQHIGLAARMESTGSTPDEVRAEHFADSVGTGCYRIDLHPSYGGDNYIDISSLPFQIPLGSLIPVRVDNLLPACKNLGVTHITNGCYRLHPVEWNIGEAAGMLAAFCVEKREIPRRVRASAALLAEFQSWLRSAGIELEWPWPRAV